MTNSPVFILQLAGLIFVLLLIGQTVGGAL